MAGCGIMAVNEESGQSVFEFLIVLPMLIGMTIILIRVNTAIQISIVDQQYARAQVLFLAFNSPFYPALDKQSSQLVANGTSQMMVGVSDNPAGASNYSPKATVQLIARSKANSGSDSPQEEPAGGATLAKGPFQETPTPVAATSLATEVI